MMQPSLRLLLSAAVTTLLLGSVNAQRVVGLQLVQSGTGAFVANLFNGTIVYLNGTTPNFSVLAVTTGNIPTSTGILFGWNSRTRHRTDRFTPYTMCGGSNFARCTNLTATSGNSGSHTVTATIINATTLPGSTFTVTFALNAGFAAPSPLAPVPIAAPLPAPVPATSPLPATTTTTFVPIRINCGALVPYTDSMGRVWSADQFFSGGSTYDSAVPIADTTEDALYNCERYGAATYSIPVPPAIGSYTVVLHFAEIYHTTVARRVFDISVEGQMINDLDLVQLGGGTAFKALTRQLSSVVVSDGFLTIQLLDNVPLVDFPKLSAIEVWSNSVPIAPPIRPPTKAPVVRPIAPLPPPSSTTTTFAPIRINCGGATPYTDTLGQVWSADTFFTGGQTFDSPFGISETEDDTLYNCERYGHSTYSIPVPSGTYTVNLLLAEIYHTTAGKRVYDISVEGQLINDIDIVLLGGGIAFKAITRQVTVQVSDGLLTIQLLDNVPAVDFPKLSGIEIVQASAGPIPPAPVKAPTKAPIKAPTIAPVKAPTIAPVKAPTKVPVKAPTKAPVNIPTRAPVKAPPTPIAAPPSSSANFEPILINCGGDAYIDSLRRPWQADAFFTGGQAFGSAGLDIADTLDDDIYNSNRWGSMQYNVPVPSGLYEVVLHLSETYFTTEGQRVFNVKLELSTDITNIDIIQLGQGIAKRAVTRTASATVRDGFLTIQFLANPGKDNPTIAGIEISRLGEAPPMAAPVPTVPVASPPFEPVLISCGSGKDFIDKLGRRWLSDRYSRGGATYVNVAPAIANTEDDTLYHSDRWGSEFFYEIPLQEGNYKVILHFAEIYPFYTEKDTRKFDIVVEGDLIEDVDIVKEAGAIFTAMKRETLIIPVTDGVLNIQFKQNDPQIDNPKISAIEINKASEHSAHSVPGGPYFAVDLDASGSELVPVNALGSHTHGSGRVLVSYTWKLGDTILGTEQAMSLNLPVGEHVVSLTVTDNTGNVGEDTTTITVRVRGYPDLFSLSPLSGPISGGTTITLNGQDIGTATGVKFGRALVTSGITVINKDTIRVVTPVAAVGVPVAVSVVTPLGESSKVFYTFVSTTPVEFAVQEILLQGETEMKLPTAVAFGPDGKLYVGTHGGKLARFTLNDSYDTVVSYVVTNRFPNNKDMCILGIAFDPTETPELGDQISVYIALSEIYHGEYRNSYGQAVNGRIQVVRGANLDQVTNVVTGLPISEKDHALNGMHFGDNGELYVAIGGNTNAGLPGKLTGSERQTESYFSAAILVVNLARPGFDGFIKYDADIDGSPVAGFGPNGVEIFAAGTRNPYSVYYHSSGKIYATDNGGDKGLGPRATGCAPGQNTTEFKAGDQLLLIKRGRYYGHPNHKRAKALSDPRQCVWRNQNEPSDAQFTAPILKTPSSLGSVIEFEADHFKGQMRGDLIISKYNDALQRVILSADGETVNPFSDPIVQLAGTGGLAVTQAPDGSLIDARYASHKCFVYKPVEAASTVLEIKAVFPRRGVLAGGSKLTIFGVNFRGTPTVTVGGGACTNAVVISATKMTCLLPMGTLGKKDVVVTIGAASDTYAGGYRYITGRPL